MNSFNKLVRDKIPEIINEHFINFRTPQEVEFHALSRPLHV